MSASADFAAMMSRNGSASGRIHSRQRWFKIFRRLMRLRKSEGGGIAKFRMTSGAAGGMGGEFSFVFRGGRGDSPRMLATSPHAAFARLFDEVGTVDCVGVEERVAKY